MRLVCPLPLILLLFLALIESAPAQDEPLILTVDARYPMNQAFSVTEVLPVRSGKVNLSFPRWVPGTHGMPGLLQNVANLKIVAGTRTLEWQRDRIDPYTLHCEVPKQTDHLTVTFDYLPQHRNFSEVAFGIAASDNIAILNGASLFFLPREQSIKRTLVQARFLLPDDWQYATALPVDTARTRSGEVTFSPVSLETFVDSPMMAGRYMETVRLDAGDGKETPHYLCLFTDDLATRDKVLTPAFQQAMKQLVRESGALFGTRHYRHFHFLLTVSNKLPNYGLEHHACTVNVLHPDVFGQKGLLENKEWWYPNLIPHEFTHSWDGKYRRPNGLIRDNYNTPQETDLLWVYEGLTEYLGEVLMVRSGFRDVEKWKLDLLGNAVQQGNVPARSWQSLEDAASTYPFVSQSGNGEGMRDSNAVYFEGFLLWFEIDTLIRKLTNGRQSLDDFCRIFFGGSNNGPEVRGYDRREVIEALNQVLPYDWDGFLATHLRAHGNAILSAGIENAGWKVTLSDNVPSDLVSRAEGDYRFSLGLEVFANGSIGYVKPGSAAARAGLLREMRIAGVNGKQFTPAVFREAVRATKGEKPAPLSLLIFQENAYRLVSLEYAGGEKFPIMERQEGTPDLIAAILAPRLSSSPAPAK